MIKNITIVVLIIYSIGVTMCYYQILSLFKKYDKLMSEYFDNTLNGNEDQDTKITHKLTEHEIEL